jgi:hypothetical protein
MWGGLQKYKVREGLIKVGQMQERERKCTQKRKNKGKNKEKEEVTAAGNKLIYTGVITCAFFFPNYATFSHPWLPYLYCLRRILAFRKWVGFHRHKVMEIM